MIDPYRLVLPILRRFDTERAHRFAIWGLKSGLAAKFYAPTAAEPILATTVWGRAFANPLGLAAGFDKNAEISDEALALGFGFVEVGGVTPLPQNGNPAPRLFRLDADRAVINRMGFNNEGLSIVLDRLARRDRKRGLVGVNLGKNKDSADAAADYAALAGRLALHADFLVVNVSSPNTPGLRALQHTDFLIGIIRAAKAARERPAPGEHERAALARARRSLACSLARSLPLSRLAPHHRISNRARQMVMLFGGLLYVVANDAPKASSDSKKGK